MLVSVVLTWGGQALGEKAPFGAFMAIDLLTALAFGLLAFRYPEKLWPGLAGCGQFLVFTFSATRALDYPLSEGEYLHALNLSGMLVLASLGFGTWASRWRVREPSFYDVAFVECKGSPYPQAR